MENSSKALLIAGGVLIAVLILSLFVYLYVTMHNFSNEYNSNIDSQKLQAFNAQFEVYNGRTDLTAQDIITVVNMVNECNSKNSDGDEITVIIPEYNTSTNRFNFMRDNIAKYTCDSIEYNEQTGKVNYIHFIKNT